MLRSGEIGFAEAYMDGDWDTPDLTTLLEFMALNEPWVQGTYERNPIGRMVRYLGHRLHRNSRRGSRRNVAYHYDLGNDFYRLWLDETMTYSSGVFAAPDQSLAEAQRNKFRLLFERLDLRPEHHLLDIGSGWGGFALYAAKRAGCRVTGVTLSHEQLEEARARAAAAGLADRVEFRLQDYREIEGRFDHIASIEMYEAVGREYWPQYFAAMQRLLAPGGRAAIQGITIAQQAFGRYSRRADFIQKYIFPGGMLAPPARFLDHARGAGLVPGRPAFHGRDYAETLGCRHNRVLACRDRILRRFDERFLRMWCYYLSYCECGFRIGRINLMQVTLSKPQHPRAGAVLAAPGV